MRRHIETKFANRNSRFLFKLTKLRAGIEQPTSATRSNVTTGSIQRLMNATMLAGEAFIAYYNVALISRDRVNSILDVLSQLLLGTGAEWQQHTQPLGTSMAVAFDSANGPADLEGSKVEPASVYDATVEAWSRALALRDVETEKHTHRVTVTALKLARAIGMSEADQIHLRRGALLHDIGKLGIPDGILLKHGPLTSQEWTIMRRHPIYAYELLSPIPFLHPALDIPYCHHEKWDGTGYPRGLKAEQIPLAARIFAVADVWDALVSNRPYRHSWPKEKAHKYIRALAGVHFDPQVAEVFLDLEACTSEPAGVLWNLCSSSCPSLRVI